MAVLQQEGNTVQPTCWTARGAPKFSLRFKVHFTRPIWCFYRSETSALISLGSSIASGEWSLNEGEPLIVGPISIFMFCDEFKLHSIVMVCLHLSGSGGCLQDCFAQCPPAVICSWLPPLPFSLVPITYLLREGLQILLLLSLAEKQVSRKQQRQ